MLHDSTLVVFQDRRASSATVLAWGTGLLLAGGNFPSRCARHSVGASHLHPKTPSDSEHEASRFYLGACVMELVGRACIAPGKLDGIGPFGVGGCLRVLMVPCGGLCFSFHYGGP